MQLTGGSLNLTTAGILLSSLLQSGGLLTGTGVVTATGASEFSGGTQSGSGTTVAQGGMALSLFPALDGDRTLQLGGSSTVNGTVSQIDLNGGNPLNGVSEIGSGTLTIATGATLDDQTTSTGLLIHASNRGVGDIGDDAVVNNQGRLIKSGSAPPSTISTTFKQQRHRRRPERNAGAHKTDRQHGWHHRCPWWIHG